MSDQSSLVQVIPPRRTAVTPADQVDMLTALAQRRGVLAGGMALEMAGEAGHIRFLARAATAAASDHLGVIFAGHYPQGTVVHVTDPGDDPARLRHGEGAVAADLRLRRRSALPLRSVAHDDNSAQLLRVIGALRTLPAGTRGVCQLILWPAPRRWSRDVARWLQHERARASQPPRLGEGPPAGVAAGLAMAVLAAWAGYHDYQVHDLARLAGLGAALRRGRPGRRTHDGPRARSIP